MVDQQGDATRHHHIIVFAVDGTETATQPFLKPTHFINGIAVVLHQQPFAHHRHQMIDDLRLREHIGLETHLEAVWFRFSAKHVAIFIFQAAKQVSRLAVGSVRFERVTLHHQQCLVVERGYGYRLFNEQIVVDMPTPLRHRFTNAVVAVDYRNHGIVGTCAASANVHTHHIFALQHIGGGHFPHFQAWLAFVDYTPFAVHLLQLAFRQWLTALCAHGIEARERKHASARSAERLGGIGGKLRHHLVVRLVTLALFVVPLDHFQRTPYSPKVALVIVETFPQIRYFRLIDRQTVDFNLIPRNEYSMLVGLAIHRE